MQSMCTVERLTRDSIEPCEECQQRRSDMRFKNCTMNAEEHNTKPPCQPTKKDFKKRKDLTRGHLASAANHKWCKKAYKETFLYTNIFPEAKDNLALNKLENFIREMRKREIAEEIFIITGLLSSNNNSLLNNRIPIPDYIFKVILLLQRDNVTSVKAYKIPNKCQTGISIKGEYTTRHFT